MYYGQAIYHLLYKITKNKTKKEKRNERIIVHRHWIQQVMQKMKRKSFNFYTTRNIPEFST
jgi:hypothetical protein